MAKDISTTTTKLIYDEAGVKQEQSSQTLTHRDSDSIEITRGQKGTYGWTIKVYGKTTDEISVNAPGQNDLLESLEQIDSKLRARFEE